MAKSVSKSLQEFRGLTLQQVAQAKSRGETNRIDTHKSGALIAIKELLTEPMVLLLLATAVLYFFSGQTGEALFMAGAIGVTTSISLYQNHRSRKALKALQVLTRPTCKVIRESAVVIIESDDIVMGDYMVVEEGVSIPADGQVVQSNDFAVNESMLTGESVPVEKSAEPGLNNLNKVYRGTTVTRGLAICEVTGIGLNTELGRIGKDVEEMNYEMSPLQKQIRRFVRTMAVIGVIFFLAVWALNYLHSRGLLDSLLKALALAMSILPEEIPVAFMVFMAMGAAHLTKLGIIIKSITTVETLGSASVICLDKTGTITANMMQLTSVYNHSTKALVDADFHSPDAVEVITSAMWASEPVPFDPMEIALHNIYSGYSKRDARKEFRMVHEYPLEGRPPMMTHVFGSPAGERIIAAKGAPEGIMRVCKLPAEEIAAVNTHLERYASQGARVLGVATSNFSGNDFPGSQQELPFVFIGLVCFLDPPKPNIKQVLSDFRDAGIKIKVITGDYAQTAHAIARQVDLDIGDETLDGERVLALTDEELRLKSKRVSLFTRMFPKAKLRVIDALKSDGQVVAMTGDGVNDALALKAAHIGIAMGKRGTEIARQVSALILTDDDLGKMVNAIAIGRKIYANLKNAIQYIISIHIPIILTVFVPLVLGWKYGGIFTPVHVIFLELIMGPTCSIVFENEPAHADSMRRPPRVPTRNFFSLREIAWSIFQGLAISLGVLMVYQYEVWNGGSEVLTRSMVFVTIVSANIFLTIVNRSTRDPFWVSLRRSNKLVTIITGVTISVTLLIIYITPVAVFFSVESLSFSQLLICIATGLISVMWIEVPKAFLPGLLND